MSIVNECFDSPTCVIAVPAIESEDVFVKVYDHGRLLKNVCPVFLYIPNCLGNPDNQSLPWLNLSISSFFENDGCITPPYELILNNILVVLFDGKAFQIYWDGKQVKGLDRLKLEVGPFCGAVKLDFVGDPTIEGTEKYPWLIVNGKRNSKNKFAFSSGVLCVCNSEGE